MSSFEIALGELMIDDNEFQNNERDHRDPDAKQLRIKYDSSKLVIKGRSFEYFEKLATALARDFPDRGIEKYLEAVTAKFAEDITGPDEELKFKFKLAEALVDIDVRSVMFSMGHYFALG